LIGTIGCAEATLAIGKTAGAIPAGFITERPGIQLLDGGHGHPDQLGHLGLSQPHPLPELPQGVAVHRVIGVYTEDRPVDCSGRYTHSAQFESYACPGL
jgi:hypothetical protein